MVRNRTIYNIYGAFAGPAPATGFHFIDESGNLNNEIKTFGGTNFNLIKNLQRVQSASYTVSLNQTNVESINKKSFVTRQNINPAEISLNLNYLQYGVTNELRLGFYSNYMQTGLSDNPGEPFYSNNFGVCLLSGFITRSDERENNDLGWPQKYRDQRNIFLVLNDTQDDLNKHSNYAEIDSNAVNYGVYGFGNCYLNSYNSSASVGGLPSCSVGFQADNIAFFASASGSHIPAVNTQRRMVTGINFAIPTIINESPVSVVRPGDITVDFSGVNNNLGIDFSDAAVTSYNLGFDLNRIPYQSFGEKIPHDRYIKFPVTVNCDFSFIYQNSNTGSIINELNTNNDYNFEIKLKNPYDNNIAVQYNIRKAKFISSSSQTQIRGNTIYNLSFQTEIDPDDYSKGLFMSGLLNVEPTSVAATSFLLQENGDAILQENNDKIIVRAYDLLY
jgi:hypothetical protein